MFGIGRICGVVMLLAFIVTAAVEPQCHRAPRLGDPIVGLSREQRAEFERGRLVFERVFTPATGLGPLFNADACAECHEEPAISKRTRFRRTYMTACSASMILPIAASLRNWRIG